VRRRSYRRSRNWLLQGQHPGPASIASNKGADKLLLAPRGEVAEWLMAPVLKTGIPERVSGVRIPPSPPVFLGVPSTRCARSGFCLPAPAWLQRAMRLNLKTGIPERVSGVRIPPSPPVFLGVPSTRCARSGFRLQAPASLTLAKRLNLKTGIPAFRRH